MVTKKCFFISPIGADGTDQRILADKVLKHVVRKGLEPAFEVERGDEPQNPGSITPQIVASILSADLIVADLTGGNPNVYYEIAIAHGYRKPTVHIQKKGDRREFDVKDMRIIPYDLDPDDIELAQRSLLKSAEFAVATPDEIETPLTSAQEFSSVRESVDPVAESNVLVLDAIGNLSRDVRRAIAATRATPRRNLTNAENLKSLNTFVERAAASGRAERAWFDSMITPGTTTAFDEWVLSQFAIGTGVDDLERAQETVWSAAMFEHMNSHDADSDEVDWDQQ